MDRRDFLQLIGGGAVLGILAGCSGRAPVSGWRDEGIHVLSGGPFDYTSPEPQQKNEVFLVPKNRTPQTPERAAPPLRKYPLRAENSGPITALSRNRWQAQSPRTARLNPMGGVNRITVHHEGNPKPNYDVTPAQVAASLRNIQAAHFRTLKAGDIGYHYIIDRQGMVWQGRDIRYQGAHSSGANSHNVGIMCLGNFNLQRPTGMQIAALERLTMALAGGYGVPPSRIYGHRELKSTACPGKYLFDHVRRIRSELMHA